MTEKPNPQRPTLEGSADAPIVSFDDAPLFSLIPGIGRVTLSAYVQDVLPDGSIGMRQVAVAHLRGNAIAWASLREAINGLELMAAGNPNPEGPAN